MGRGKPKDGSLLNPIAGQTSLKATWSGSESALVSKASGRDWSSSHTPSIRKTGSDPSLCGKVAAKLTREKRLNKVPDVWSRVKPF